MCQGTQLKHAARHGMECYRVLARHELKKRFDQVEVLDLGRLGVISSVKRAHLMQVSGHAAIVSSPGSQVEDHIRCGQLKRRTNLSHECVPHHRDFFECLQTTPTCVRHCYASKTFMTSSP